jgi:LPS export ABC transporter permease LptF/LPS export ABC transporter permease LptG
MKILDRYIFRETLIPAAIGLLTLTFVIFTRDVGTLLEVIIRQSASSAELWAVSTAILPNILTFTIPMAVLVGILTGFGRMSSDSEAVALRAVGIPMRRVLRPVMTFAGLAWLTTLVLAVQVAPESASRFRGLLMQVAMKQVSFELKPRVFQESLTNRVLYVQQIEADHLHWRGILLADMTNPEETRVHFARSGSLVRDEKTDSFQLTLADGTMHIVSPLAPSRYSFSTFDSTTISIPIPKAPSVPGKPAVSESSTADLWDRMQAGAATYEERVAFHQRFALPFACIAFALVALPLGVTTTRSGKSTGLVLSLVLMLIYYLILIGGTRVAANAQFSPFIGAWLANIGFTILGVILLLRSDREHENRLLAAIGRSIDSVSSKLAALSGARKRFGRWTHSLRHHPKFFRVLDIYVLRGFWFFFFLVLVVFVSLFIIVTLFELLPDIVKNNVATSVVVSYFVFLLPQIAYYMIPITVLLAILINLGTLTKMNEILAVKAGAISLYRMAIPLLITGLLMSGAIYLLQDLVLPYSNQRQEDYRNVIKGRAPQTYRDPNRKWMVGSDNRIYNYKYFDPTLNVFADISVFGFKPDTLELNEWTFATRASWEGNGWNFEDGWVRSLGADKKGSTYSPFHALKFAQLDTPEYFKKEVRGGAAAQMRYSELKKYVKDLEQSGFDVSALTVDLNRKLSFPLVTFIMVIIGIPFSFTTGRKGTFYGIGLCIVVGIFYWSMFELFDKLGGINQLSPVIAAWFPNLIFGFGGLWMMLRVKT